MVLQFLFTCGGAPGHSSRVFWKRSKSGTIGYSRKDLKGIGGQKGKRGEPKKMELVANPVELYVLFLGDRAKVLLFEESKDLLLCTGDIAFAPLVEAQDALDFLIYRALRAVDARLPGYNSHGAKLRIDETVHNVEQELLLLVAPGSSGDWPYKERGVLQKYFIATLDNAWQY